MRIFNFDRKTDLFLNGLQKSLMRGIIFTLRTINQVLSNAQIAQYLPRNKIILSFSACFMTSKAVQSNIPLTISKYYIRNATLITTQVHRKVAVFILSAAVLLSNTKFVHYLHKQLQVISMEVITHIPIA